MAFDGIRSRAYSYFLLIHSVIPNNGRNNARRRNSSRHPAHGATSAPISPLQKPVIILHHENACVMFSARKNIQQNITTTNVNSIAPASFQAGSSEFAAGVSKYFRLFLEISSGRKQVACNIPQATNVQFAPCHKPDKRKIT